MTDTETLFANPAKKAAKLSTFEVIARLEKKYTPPSWAFFTEVKSSVGFGNRRADGIAVAMWRSLGLEIMGFEVKASRADFLREIKNAGKSDEIFQYCNRWWLVVGDPSIIKDGELPPTWGLQVPHGTGFKVAVKAPSLNPVPLTTWFVAEILRRQFNSQKRPECLEQEFQRGFEAGKSSATDVNLKYEIQKAEKLQKRVDDFEKSSGIQIDDWHDASDIGAAVKTVLEDGPEKIKQNLGYARVQVERVLREINEAMSKF